MGRIIEAKAVISGEDRLSKLLDGIARKFKDVGKSSRIAADVGKLGKELDNATKGLRDIERFRSTHANFAQARTAYRGAQAEVARISRDLDAARKAAQAFDGIKSFSKSGGIAAEMASARRSVADLERQFVTAQRAVKASASSFESQAAAIKGVRSELKGSGLNVGKLVAEQGRLKTAVDQTTAAILRQERAQQAEARLASGMSEHGRRTMARIAQGRYVAEAMSAPARAAAADSEAARQSRAERRAQRRAERIEAGTTLGAGVAVAGAHRGKEIAKDAITSAAEFDLAVRKQRVFTDISGDEQAGLLSQAKRIGQETQFSNIDVVKAQTAAMQGLPASFAPGLKAAVAEGIVQNVRNFSTLMETDLKDGTETIRSYLQATGKDISTKEKALTEANKAVNQIVKMAKLGGMNGEDAAQFVKYAAASSTSAGVSTDSMLALGALARRGGLRGDEAGVAMRSMAGKIVSPTDKGLAALNAAGIKYSDYVHMPDRLSTDALEGQFRNKLGKGFTPAIRKRLDAINGDKAIIGDSGKYAQAVVSAVGDILGKTKAGVVRASDAKKAAKATTDFHKLSAQSVDAEGLLDAAMKSNMTLPQLNAWLTDKHGGKGAITQRQWDEFKASREAIGHAGDDPDWAKKKADEVFAGLGGSVENLKGSFENLVLTIGNANAGLIKWSADSLGNGLDAFSKLPEGAQQGLSLGAGAALTAAGAWGSLKLMSTLLGIGGRIVAPAGAAAGSAASAQMIAGMGGAGGTAGAGLAGAGLAGAGLMSSTITAAVAAGFSAYATAQIMPKVAAEKGATGIDYATGGALEESPMAGIAPDRPILRDWWSATMPSWLGGSTGAPVPVEVKTLPSGADASGQVKALGNTLDKAADASATTANGGRPIEATLKPDQVTAKVETLPPVSGEATVTVENHHEVRVTLNTDLLEAKVNSAASRAVAKIPLSSGGRPGGVSMPGAAGTPGAK